MLGGWEEGRVSVALLHGGEAEVEGGTLQIANILLMVRIARCVTMEVTMVLTSPGSASNGC